MNKPIIETSRIILREFEPNDYKDVYEFGSNKTVQKYTGDPLLTSIEEAKKLISDVWLTDYKKYGFGRWATIYKPTNKLIGFTGLKFLPDLNLVDIGFRYLPDYWNKGIATEASKEILKYGFELLKLNEIFGIAYTENIASCKVLKKIGLKFYKQDEFDGDGKLTNWYKLEKNDFNLI